MQYHIRPWRSWITQRIPIPENGSSNLFGRTKLIGISCQRYSYQFLQNDSNTLTHA